MLNKAKNKTRLFQSKKEKNTSNENIKKKRRER